tara:strand:- start:2385 stop:2585 length:201 start_codon:yes stop_codon:yes gene_type:complete
MKYINKKLLYLLLPVIYYIFVGVLRQFPDPLNTYGFTLQLLWPIFLIMWIVLPAVIGIILSIKKSN